MHQGGDSPTPGSRKEGLGAEHSGPPRRKGLEVCTPGLKAGRAGACPQFLDFQVLERDRVGAPQKACVPGKHAVPQASRTPTVPVSALGLAGRQCPGARATRRQGFSGLG